MHVTNLEKKHVAVNQSSVGIDVNNNNVPKAEVNTLTTSASTPTSAVNGSIGDKEKEPVQYVSNCLQSSGDPQMVQKSTAEKQVRQPIAKIFKFGTKSDDGGNQGDIYYGESTEGSQTQLVFKTIEDPEVFEREINAYILTKGSSAVLKYVGYWLTGLTGTTELIKVLVLERGGTALNKLYYACGGTVNLATSITITKGIIIALRAFHGRDLVHNDVKGDNLLLSNAKTIQIINLGCTVKQNVQAGALGTPRHMSPHVMKEMVSYKADKRDDLLSLISWVAQYVLSECPWKKQLDIMNTLLKTLSDRPEQDVNGIKPYERTEWTNLIDKKMETMPTLFNPLGNAGLNNLAKHIWDIQKSKGEKKIDYVAMVRDLDLALSLTLDEFFVSSQLDWDERFFWLFKDPNVLHVEVNSKPLAESIETEITITVGPFYADALEDIRADVDVVLLEELDNESVELAKENRNLANSGWVTNFFFSTKLKSKQMESFSVLDLQYFLTSDLALRFKHCYMGFGYYMWSSWRRVVIRVQGCLERWDEGNKLKKESVLKLKEMGKSKIEELLRNPQKASILDEYTATLSKIPKTQVGKFTLAFAQILDDVKENINADIYFEWGFLTTTTSTETSITSKVDFYFRKLDAEVRLLSEDIATILGSSITWSTDQPPREKLDTIQRCKTTTGEIRLSLSVDWDTAKENVIEEVKRVRGRSIPNCVYSNAKLFVSPQNGTYDFLFLWTPTNTSSRSCRQSELSLFSPKYVS